VLRQNKNSEQLLQIYRRKNYKFQKNKIISHQIFNKKSLEETRLGAKLSKIKILFWLQIDELRLSEGNF
jgi:hypothetical protein